MQREYQESDKEIIIQLAGSYDIETSRDIGEFYTNLSHKNKENYIIDMKDVSFIDSFGLGTLVGFLKKVKEHEGKVQLLNLNPHVLNVFKLTHLDRVFDLSN